MTTQIIAKLAHKVAIYVPGTEGLNGPRDNSDVVATIASLFSEQFGGATAIPGTGYYKAENGQLITEHITIVYANVDKLTDRAQQFVFNHALNTKKLLSQECVAVEIDNTLFLV